jgi:CRISPR-associated protein Cpf1
MRNSNAETGEDFISSPVENNEGICFDSRLGKENLPKDADANGAYHIALKGLLVLEKIRRDEKRQGDLSGSLSADRAPGEEHGLLRTRNIQEQ